MEKLINYIVENKEWIFSGIGIGSLSLIGGLLFKKRNSLTQEQKNEQKNEQIVTLNINSEPGKTTLSSKEDSDRQSDLLSSKEYISILFIDDQTFDYIEILRQAGYKNVKKILDVKRLDSNEIVKADVIFVDINGVGTKLFPAEQGLGVAKALKKRYGNKKKVYLYSAQHQELSSDFNTLDGVLSKNADPYEFVNIIDNLREKRD